MKPVFHPSERPAGKPVAEYVNGWPSGSEPTSCSVVDCPAVDDRFPGFCSVGGALL
jgi:hypothetical protein